MKVLFISGKEVLVDDEDYTRILQYSWWLSKDSRSENYFTIKGKVNNQTFYLHRFILNLSVGDKSIVDHINRNTLDNRKSNLRLVNQSINRLNSTKRFNKTGYTGVTKEYNYTAELCKERLGSFRTAEQAALYRDKILLERYGENVEFNFDLSVVKNSPWPIPLGRGDSLRGVDCPEKQIYERPDKQTLNKLIWSESITKISEKIGCSDNAVRKWCRKYNLETPSSGFWAKIYAGKLEGQSCPLI